MTKQHERPGTRAAKSEADELDALNSAMRERENASRAVRRSIESEIEANAKKRRRGEGYIGSGGKRQG
jgi:hypothetical protein